jgi:hypothetical protein
MMKWPPVPRSRQYLMSVKNRSKYSRGARSIACVVSAMPVGTWILSVAVG